MPIKKGSPPASSVRSFSSLRSGTSPFLDDSLSEPSPWGGGFRVLRTLKRQAIVLLFGAEKTGKTTFVTAHCPEPIAFFNFDDRSDHAVKKALDAGRQIAVSKIFLPSHVSQLDHDKARLIGQATLDRVLSDLDIAVELAREGKVRTICLDTGSELDNIITLAIKGREDRGKNDDFGASIKLINSQWLQIFRLVRQSPANFIVLGRESEIYSGRDGTGEFKFSGSKVVSAAVDWAGNSRIKQTKTMVGVRREYQIKITNSGVNGEELGKIYTEENWKDIGGPFAFSCLMQYEGSNLEDWT